VIKRISTPVMGFALFAGIAVYVSGIVRASEAMAPSDQMTPA
jgi:hypothetical protein